MPDILKNFLKSALSKAPVLAYPTQNDNFILDTDASNYGMGAVLSQIQNNSEKVVFYFSKSFSGPERKYCVTRRELLAIVISIKHFHHYLYGRRFTVRTDHGALRWLLNFKNPEGQMARWLEILSSYDFEIIHRAGKSHSNADSLSRHPCFSSNCKHCHKSETKESLHVDLKDQIETNQTLSSECVGSNHTINDQICRKTKKGPEPSEKFEIPIPPDKIVDFQNKDPNLSTILQWKKNPHKPVWQDVAPSNDTLKYYWQRWDSLVVENDILYYKWESEDGRDFTLKLVVPKELQTLVLEQVHNSVTSGHLGIKKTMSKVQFRFFWYQLRNDVKKW